MTNNGTAASKYAPCAQASAQVPENEGGRILESHFQDFSSVRGNPMSDVDNASQYDRESVREVFMIVKNRYESLVEYCTGGRQAIVDSMQMKLSSAHMVAMSMQHINPHGRSMLQGLMQEQEISAEEDRARVQHFDGQVKIERMEMLNELTGLLHAGPGGTINNLVREFNWPTLDVCQDLGLPMDYQDATGGVTVQEGPQDTAETIFLKQRIAMLEAQMQKSNQAQVTTKPEVAVKGQVRKLDPVFLEGGRRHKFEMFSKGAPYEAQHWVNRYEVLANYPGFTNKEKTEELVAGLVGDTLDWFIGLEPFVKDDWEEVNKAFLHLHAQGSDPTLNAFDELKTYKQGDKLMKTFGPEITSLLQRAGIYQPSIQNATEMEQLLSRAKKTTYMGPVQYDPENTVEEQQNYQKGQRYRNDQGGRPRFGGYRRDNKRTEDGDNRFKDMECYKCGKKGHIQRNCYVKREHKQNQQDVQEEQVQCEQQNKVQAVEEEEDISDEEDIDVFAHLLHNNNQDVKQDQEARHTMGGERFKIKATDEDGRKQDVLVDTGSTISTISKEAVMNLDLREFACKQQIIQYGEARRACLLVVPDRNEEVILGMDLLEKEAIVLHPKKKMVYKNTAQESNNADLMVQEFLNRYPRITREDEEQSVTTALYEHSIDTGTAAPTATVKDKFPLPLISDLLEQFHGYTRFTTCDLKSGFWQLPLNKTDGSALKPAF
ncbi:hypothetical protein [Parasitella parasitica]|uniref:CCHC-type domain-containing protein n=1 Tax=Parasitella parasitica TaxID=35722 RepID=A0A0B7N634_9FUNG|nr:hypothetical protein [Parasitella parasitica]